MGRCNESLREEVTRALKGGGSLDPLLALQLGPALRPGFFCSADPDVRLGIFRA